MNNTFAGVIIEVQLSKLMRATEVVAQTEVQVQPHSRLHYMHMMIEYGPVAPEEEHNQTVHIQVIP